MPDNNLQLDETGKLRHFLSIEGLNQTVLTEILDTADSFTSVTDRTIKKVPILRGKTVANLFFEASTRTFANTSPSVRSTARRSALRSPNA